MFKNMPPFYRLHSTTAGAGRASQAKEVSEVKIIIEANTKEIADLIAALQGRLDVVLNPARLAEAICGTDQEAQEQSCS